MINQLLSRPKGVLRVFPGNETNLNPTERENWPIHDRALEDKLDIERLTDFYKSLPVKP